MFGKSLVILLVLVALLVVALGTLSVLREEKLDTADGHEQSMVHGAASLDLSGKGLTTVPAYVFGRTDLVALDLSKNSLSGALPAEVRKLSRLKHLDLSDNAFTGVPAEVGQLAALEYLDLSNNALTGLPYELGNLSRLKTLDLRGNAPSAEDLARIRTTLPEAVTILLD